MKWDSALYDDKHDFVSKYGQALIDSVNTAKGQVILDLGCGTGKLTVELAKNGAQVIGIDMSEEMIRKAKTNYPYLNFHIEDATELKYENCFDTIFSNAVLHWIKDQKKLLSSIYKALKKGGKLICEFGAKGCAYNVQKVFSEEYEALGYTYTNPFFFPPNQEFEKLLIQAGFKIERIIDFDRPTPLNDGDTGLKNWINQFYFSNLAIMKDEDREKVLSSSEERLKPLLYKKGTWIVDYRRIQVEAIK
ncbi:trans-aconitate 2-methyltransferase [Oxobacter pfennigii]|uniref:Trans-aconitate 2-methyltransferase n=1 Tax=Oxobacter pfennigii TaxID=36849 RepID=A0A0P8WCV1_9CLOT|nr:class I SAM-dependent methyltransferase [Oxobacter pfennigii]KPU45595.1 trans-aconitate 2-methyltransferase [Oxobacter pfennigii]